MNDMEKRLWEEKQRIDQLEAPPEMEERLRTALNTAQKKRKPISSIWKGLTAAILLIMLVGYNYQAFAYYGKKIIGYDEVISGTLKELNEAGMGQSVNETVSLGNGSKLTIDGLMTDANQMVVYYTITDPTGNIENSWSDLFSPTKITGFFTNAAFTSSEGMFNDEGTELKGMMYFETPNPFAKTLTLHYSQIGSNGHWKDGEIAFAYHPNQAMQTEIKQSIHKTVTVDKGKVTFDKIVASPMSTVVKGSLNVENFDRLPLGLDGIKLVANGGAVDRKGSGHSSTWTGGRSFELRFDALPEQLHSLEIHFQTFIGYKKLDVAVDLQSFEEEAINIGGEQLVIHQVTSTEKGIEVTITTDESILLDEVSVEGNQISTPIETTVGQTLTKQENGAVLKKRTMIFPTTEEPEQLIIGGLHFMKEYNQKIEVPVK